jgi:NADPH:quinone reductase
LILRNDTTSFPRDGSIAMSEPRNRVVQVKRFGGPEGLEVADAPLPKAARGEVRVRVLASSLEYTDVLIRRHLYPQTAARRPPFVMGYGLVGEIDQLGAGVDGFHIGERVADMTVIGSNATYCTLKANDITRVPTTVDVAAAAALILSWTTAYQLLHRAAHVQKGQRVLVHGAAGAVGQALIVLGAMAGLELWGAARGAHAALIRSLGAIPIDYDHQDFTRVLPGGFEVVFDGIGEDGYRRSFAALKGGGLLCAYGYSAGVQAQRRMLTMLMWIARLYLWRWLPAGKRARFYSINVMRARHPAWFREDLEKAFRPVGNRRHPAARRRADRFRRRCRGASPSGGRRARGQARPVSRTPLTTCWMMLLGLARGIRHDLTMFASLHDLAHIAEHCPLKIWSG